MAARVSHSPSRRLRDHVRAAQAVAFQYATGPRCVDGHDMGLKHAVTVK